MGERFHRQLKAALRATSDPQSWTEFLPIVLLGCRTAVKADLGFCSAELLYGTTLAFPGTMLAPDNSSSPDPTSYVTRLRLYFSCPPPMHPRDQSIPSHVPPDIDKWTHVFVRDDSVRRPLVSPYKGPFHVLSHTPKTFSLDINGRAETVSVDRLKRAHFEVSIPFDDTPDTSTFDPLQPPTHPPAHTPLTTPSPTPTLSSPLPNTNKPYGTTTGRTVHWPKKLRLFICDIIFCVSCDTLCVLLHKFQYSAIEHFVKFCACQFIFLAVIVLFDLLHFCTISCWLRSLAIFALSCACSNYSGFVLLHSVGSHL
ncbi:uncharacterized protein LOC115209240 [Octopus sinensis]|uniref:Uncharacterized protein LOC115209240 n=1 Tax=Octopus sinensis TaxID=2607531 RepID=A0A6P7S5I5_9MOLL|nr:uncharacterized protein LOC115209240 [Octopus sinensis]